MNADIASAQQNLIYQYGIPYVSQMYPFLYNGIYVLAVQDFGGSDVILTISINFFPVIPSNHTASPV
jgi:hypothetical protein